MTPNPYAADLGDRDPLEAMERTPLEVRALVQEWSRDRFERSYAPGKWSIRRVLIHLAQTELALGTRLRFALSQEAYTAQPFSQDAWIALEDQLDAHTALDVYTALRRMNIAMLRRLSAAQMERPFTHPEYGELTVGWVASQLAGHDIHHLEQIRKA